MATWTPLGGSDKWMLNYNSEQWFLVATPDARKPWLLYTTRRQGGRDVRDKTQEIGAITPEGAQHMAEHWLGIKKFVII